MQQLCIRTSRNDGLGLVARLDLRPMLLDVRIAAPDETAIVSDILTEAATWLRNLGMPLWSAHEVSVAGITADVTEGLYHLAWSEGTAVGTLRLANNDSLVWPEAVDGAALYLHRLAVRRAVAGGEVSCALLKWAVEQTCVRGLRYLRLDCERSRPTLRAIYEQFGFAWHSDQRVGNYLVARFQFDCVGASIA